MENEMIIFEDNQIRKIKYNNEIYYSVIDIIKILTDSDNPRDYWYRLKKRMTEEEKSEVSTKCRRLKLIASDGKFRETDVATRETIFRIIQSVPSPNAEPFKLWFAKIAEERIRETIDPSLAIERAKKTYLSKGYDEEWTNARIKGIGARNDLTNEWKNRGATAKDYAILTDEISKGTFNITTEQHKQLKNLHKENLRDNMSALELVLTTLAEVTTTELHKSNNSKGIKNLSIDAKQGGAIAGKTRENIEMQLNRPVLTSQNANDFKKKIKQENLEIEDKKKFKN